MNKIALPSPKGFKMVAVANIVRCEADSNYTTVVLVDGSRIIISRNLKILEKALKSSSFIRVHHSHIVNLNFVDHFVRNGGGKLYLINGEVIGVSRSRQKELMNRVNLI